MGGFDSRDVFDLLSKQDTEVSRRLIRIPQVDGGGPRDQSFLSFHPFGENRIGKKLHRLNGFDPIKHRDLAVDLLTEIRMGHVDVI